MDGYNRLLKEAFAYVRSQTDFVPRVAMVLGSGLNEHMNDMEKVLEVPYGDIPGFPVSTAPGHDGRYIFGYVSGVPAVVLKGRIHYYEGYPMPEVVMPQRLARLLGAETLILTNAAGGINTGFNVGDLMLITDHISSFMPSPLREGDWTEYGPVFPDMSNVYDRDICDRIRKAAADLGMTLREGVYVQTGGPQFESKAEIRMFRMLGADAVGMSTVVEAIAAHQMGMKVCGISCISNMACGVTDRPLSGEEVNEATERVAKDFARLMKAVVAAVA